jgi:hypothetical protein
MEKKKIHIVVADGRVESVFSDEDIEVEVIDFDGSSYEEQEELGDYVDDLRANLKETIC